MKLAPAGVDPEVVAKAVSAVASKPGNTFQHKQIAEWRLLGQGKLKEGELELEATFVVVKSAKQLQLATITLSVECLMSARVSSAHADFMGLQSESMRDCILAVITRNFSNRHFALSKFVDALGGAPKKTLLTVGFGEAEKCEMSASVAGDSRTVEQDREIYPWFHLALLYLVIADVPSLDFGFSTAMMWFAKNTTLFAAMGVPLKMVTRCICKMMAHAQRTRAQIIAYPDEVDDLILKYVDSEAITKAKQQLMGWCAEDYTTR